MDKYYGFIYKITNNINGKIYIGKTNNISRRWAEHKYGNKNVGILNKAFKKYGIENFSFNVILQLETFDIKMLNKLLNNLEIFFIKSYNTYRNGYNATTGGEGICNYKHSEKTKQKISESHKGKTLSKEERQRVSTLRKGVKHTPEAVAKIRYALLHRDPEIYRKIAEKRKGIKLSDEHLKKLKKWSDSRKLSVLQYSLDGIFIKEYRGISEIENYNDTNIIACCKNKLNSAYGFIWRYKNSDNFPLKIEAATNVHINNKNIYQYTKDNKFIRSFKSSTEASKLLGICRTGITNCLNGRSESAGGFIWKYIK